MTGDLTRLPHGLDKANGACVAVIETPRGSRTKYDYDPASGLFKVKSVLPEGMSFPLDFGFIPSTLAEDGDPLDVMVFADEALCVGALLDVRLIGVIDAEDTVGGHVRRNDRLLAVAAASRLHGNIRAPGDLPSSYLDQLGSFWSNKGALEGKAVSILGTGGADAAVRRLEAATVTDFDSANQADAAQGRGLRPHADA